MTGARPCSTGIVIGLIPILPSQEPGTRLNTFHKSYLIFIPTVWAVSIAFIPSLQLGELRSREGE